MTISINYQKRKNTNLFSKFQTNKNIELDNPQNYIPIYDRFFSLNNTNWNSTNLNHSWSIIDIKSGKDNVFLCRLKNNISEEEETKKIFIKLAPLLDPCKYIVGKYDNKDENLFNLPTLDNLSKIHPKIANPHNASYVDGFFSFLTSKLLYEHNFIHGVDYYGSFLGIKKNYSINIIDDLDYLIQSDFFIKQKNNLFTVEDYSHLVSCKELKPINISTSLKSNMLSIKSLDEDIFENIFADTVTDTDTDKITELIDITNDNLLENDDNTTISNHNCLTNKSNSSCSSRSSHTNDDDLSDIEYEEIDETNDDKLDDYCSDNSTFFEEKLMLTIPKFPVQMICMELCDTTFDNLITSNNLSDEEWFSALIQIIMILITYQKLFLFTHNDLHTNNIMYVETNKKFIYYVYKKKTYKVPTFGRIYKIIDFGRAIYKFNGKIFCSDSFQSGGDASTQYNTEPFFNDKKPRLEPNFSFDLCRLACSIFDYIVDDFEITKNLNNCSPLVRIITEWLIDDNGINVLYKNSGVERYPDFKLYKMIARCVHNHTPQSQLDRKEFSKYVTTNKKISNTDFIINIDELPSYSNIL